MRNWGQVRAGLHGCIRSSGLNLGIVGSSWTPPGNSEHGGMAIKLGKEREGERERIGARDGAVVRAVPDRPLVSPEPC